MNFKLFKIGLICAAISLASCGGGGDSGTTSGGTTGVSANTGTVTVTTLPGNVVSIGASGTNFKTADATGKAVFTGLPAGAVDVHVFSTDGYSATSYMGINSATVVDTTAGVGSVVDVYVQVVNADVYGQNLYLHTADNDYVGSPINFAGTYSFYLYDKPAGTAISGTLYMAQGQATSSANAIYGQGEAVNLGNVSFTTQDPATSTVQQNFTATFSATPVTVPLLATVQSITPPLGLSVKSLNVGDAYIFAKAPATNMLFPDTIHAADTGIHTWFIYSADAAAPATTKEWFYQAPFTVGASLSATATLTAFPTVAANQAGSTISWTNPTGSWSLNGVYIHDAKYNVTWSIITDPSVSSITLPTVPAAANSLITAGTAYQIDVTNSKFSRSYVEAISNPSVATGFESISTTNVAYTR